MSSNDRNGPTLPWWRVGVMWLAFGGPAVVVVASFITLGFAIHNRDMPLSEEGAGRPLVAQPAAQALPHAGTAQR